MKRMGKYTGAIYPKDYDFKQCPECCTQITEAQSENTEFILKQRAKDILDCARCGGCPAALRNLTKEQVLPA